MNTTEQIPDGYMLNAQGHLVPIDTIKKIDMERDKLVKQIVGNAKAQQAQLAAFKSAAMGSVETFIQRSVEQYGVELGGAKGNVSLVSYDGKYKVQLAVSDRLTFSEQIQAAKVLIDECLHEWTKNSRSEIKALIENAFQTDKEGKINIGRIFGLMKLNINEPKWKTAMDAIRDSIQVEGTTSYLRIYERQGQTNKYEQVTLDIAGL